jgi:hypothetical protein
LAEIAEQQKELEKEVTQKYQKLRNRYYEVKGELELQWQEWLKKEYLPVDLNDDHNALIYARAWGDGHSNGYEQVESKYIDYCDFVEQLLTI